MGKQLCTLFFGSSSQRATDEEVDTIPLAQVESIVVEVDVSTWRSWTQAQMPTKDNDKACTPSKYMLKSMGYLLKTLACKESKINCLRTTGNWVGKGQESTYSGSEDLWWWGVILEKVSQDQGQEALARTQVYLSKTKLGAYLWVSSILYTKSTRGVMMS